MLNNDNNRFKEQPFTHTASTSEHYTLPSFPNADTGKENKDQAQSVGATGQKKGKVSEILKEVAAHKVEENEDRSPASSKPIYRISSSKSKHNKNKQAKEQALKAGADQHSLANLVGSQDDKTPVKSKNKNNEQLESDEEEGGENLDQVASSDLMSLTLKKQSLSANYQTASFGGLRSTSDFKQKSQSKVRASAADQMFTSMSDIGFAGILQIIPADLREKMTDNASNWKIRTQAIDEILQIITDKISADPHSVQGQTEFLMEFFVSLLGDQNFKIVLTTLAIINKLLSVPFLLNTPESTLSTQILGRYVPQLVKKLGDSKNIIRQEAIRALISIFEIMKLSGESNFLGLVLPYLTNSSNWHVREELLNVLMICFLRSRDFFAFDAFQVVEAVLKLLEDVKDRVRLLALEALVCYASIGNKFTVKEIAYQLVDQDVFDVVTQRIDLEMAPFINAEGALEMPYLEQLEMAGNNASGVVTSSIQRRDSMSSNQKAPLKAHSSNPAFQQNRGVQSGRRIVPPSANSISNQAQSIKRTVSANNQKQLEDSYFDKSPAQYNMMYSIDRNDINVPSNVSNFGFLPQLQHHNSQQYSNNYYTSNNSMSNNSNSANMSGLKLARKHQSDNVSSYLHQKNSSINMGSNQVSPLQQQLAGEDRAFSGNGQKYNGSIYNINTNHQIGYRDNFSSYASNNLPSSSQQSQRMSIAKSRQTPYESQNSQAPNAYPQSQKISRGGQEEHTPIRAKNTHTFYSDGSFTTTSTSLADKMKAMSQQKRTNYPNNQMEMLIETSGSTHASTNHASVILGGAGSELHSRFESQNSSVTKGQRNQSMIMGSSSKGPVKATRAAIKKDDPPAPQAESQPATTDLQNLCIDNRKRRLVKGARNNDIQEVLTNQAAEGQEKCDVNEAQMLQEHAEGKPSPIPTKTKYGMGLTGMSKTHISDLDDSNQRYIPTDELEALENPEKDFKKCMNQMIKAQEWNVQFEACNIIRRVTKHHSSLILQQGTQLHTLITALIKMADSLRSSVSKNALMTINDMFVFLKRCMEPDLDSLLKVLLKRGSDTNTFISDEAEKALISLCNSCQDSKVLSILLTQNTNSKSNMLRQKICRCLETLVKNLGNNILFFKDSDKLINQLAIYLGDACQEVRALAKSGLLFMSQSIMGQNDLERLLQRVLNESQYKKVRDFLDKEPSHLAHPQSQQLDFVITNANNHYIQGKKQVSKLNVKGPVRQASLNKSNVTPQGEQSLNIQATKIIKPSQIKKRNSQTALFKSGQGVIDQFFTDTMKDLILQSQTSDWKQRLDLAGALFDFIDQNAAVFKQKTQGLLLDMVDAICRLVNDQNAKIQQQALERFSLSFTNMQVFVEQHIVTFFQSLVQNLAATNTGVRRATEAILCKINEGIDKSSLIQPLVSLIQFGSNPRLKPLLIDQLIELMGQLDDPSSASLSKNILPLGFKLLEDNKNEVKIRTEKLLRMLHQVLGQQMLDQCPQPKLQRLCDIVMSSSSAGGGTFGANVVSGILGVKSS